MMAQGLGLRAPNAEGAGVQSLVGELDPTCYNRDMVQPN